LVHLYNVEMDYNPLQLKWLIIAYTGKEAFNTRGVTLHSALYIPFKKLEYFPINNEKMDTLKIFLSNFVYY
jgi:hypothetical protein